MAAKTTISFVPATIEQSLTTQATPSPPPGARSSISSDGLRTRVGRLMAAPSEQKPADRTHADSTRVGGHARGRSPVDIIDVNESRTALEVRWRDGSRSRFPYQWLRDNCTCAECGTTVTGARFLRLVDIPADVRPEETTSMNVAGWRCFGQPAGIFHSTILTG